LPAPLETDPQRVSPREIRAYVSESNYINEQSHPRHIHVRSDKFFVKSKST